MELIALTTIAQWLNTFFAEFDKAIFTFGHNLHQSAGGFLDTFFGLITRLGDGGIFFIILGVIFLLFKKTRKAGLGMLLALLIGALFTNLVLKELVARPRPYVDESNIFHQWWLDVGHGIESEFSFPSGHTTASFAAMGAFFAFLNKKWSWLGLVLATLIAFSRIYIVVHYPSDILGGIVVGVASAVIAYFITNAISKKIKKSNGKFATWAKEWNLIKLKNA